jgi:predicted Zn-dependent peptidase
MKKSLFIPLFLVAMLFTGCKNGNKENSLSIPFEKYTLPNGLTVVLNVDKSDPIACLAIYYHVGSSR